MIPLSTENNIAGYSPLAFIVIVLVIVILAAVAWRIVSRMFP